MTDPVLITIILAVPSTIAAVGSFIAVISSLRNKKKLENLEVKADKLSGTVTQIHLEINSRFSELLRISGESERAKGVDEGRKMGVVERQDRVAEEERVSDRADLKAKEG